MFGIALYNLFAIAVLVVMLAVVVIGIPLALVYLVIRSARGSAATKQEDAP